MEKADRGVSSAIATVLMVAIVVVLAAAISVSFFDVTADLNEPAPNVADTTGEFRVTPPSERAGDKQIVRITHVAGDNVAVAEIEIIVRASGPGADLPTEARLVDLPAEGQYMTANIDGDGGLIDNGSSTANIIVDDSSNVWTAGDTIRFRIGVESADFRDPPPSYNTDKKSDTLEVIIIHTPSNSILAEHTFTPR